MPFRSQSRRRRSQTWARISTSIDTSLWACRSKTKKPPTDISAQPVAQYLGPIKALDGTVIASGVPVAQFRALLLAATQAIGALRAQLATTLAAINTTPTTEALRRSE